MEDIIAKGSWWSMFWYAGHRVPGAWYEEVSKSSTTGWHAEQSLKIYIFPATLKGIIKTEEKFWDSLTRESIAVSTGIPTPPTAEKRMENNILPLVWLPEINPSGCPNARPASVSGIFDQGEKTKKGLKIRTGILHPPLAGQSISQGDRKTQFPYPKRVPTN